MSSGNIKIDFLGYAPGAVKVALSSSAGAFTVRRTKDDAIVFRGRSSALSAVDVDSGDRLASADFSALNEGGEYVIDWEGSGRSAPFLIANGLTRRAYLLTARSFYGQRCGTAVDLGPSFPGFRHGECHREGAFHPSSGRSGAHVSEKGWHDAGDYGRYVVNSGISTATLLWAAELFEEKTKAIALDLPESGNGTPDLLNEARWNIDWMLTMQDADGGVWHKQTSAQFCPFIQPQADRLPSLVIGSGQEPFKTTCATADFAAVTAIAARVYARYDAEYAERCLAAARRAWTWLREHPAVLFHNPAGIGTGEYGDKDCADEILWAAAELARTTKAAEFNEYFSSHNAAFLPAIAPDDPPSWPNMAPFALWTYALGKGADARAVAAIVERSKMTADAIVERAAATPYRIPMVRKNYVWGSTGVLANYCLQLLVAHRLHPDPRYRETAAEGVHYLLGRNPLAIGYVTGMGAHSVKHIHHRPSGDEAHAENPWPGLLSGGPNPGRQDKEMQAHVPAGTSPAKCFVDLRGAYAANEVAINWNAPLVFTLAGLL